MNTPSRIEEQRRHYDKLGTKTPPAAREAGGAQSLALAFQAPYEYVDQWLTAKGLSGIRALDYGCGNGYYSIFLARQGADTTGVDISREQIAIAQARIQYLNPEAKLHFEIANCESLPFGDNAFDLILSIGTLSCLSLPAAYSEISRVLKPGGTAVIVDTLGHNPFLNLNRKIKLWRGTKTKWAVEHTLRMSDYEQARNYFGRVSLEFFDLTVLLVHLADPGGHFPGLLKPVAVFLRQADRFLLSLPVFRKMAFKVVSILSHPLKKSVSQKPIAEKKGEDSVRQ